MGILGERRPPSPPPPQLAPLHEISTEFDKILKIFLTNRKEATRKRVSQNRENDSEADDKADLASRYGKVLSDIADKFVDKTIDRERLVLFFILLQIYRETFVNIEHALNKVWILV